MRNFYTSQEGFLGLEKKVSFNESKIIVVPYGLENTVSFVGGTKNGPKAILRASHEVELFDEELWFDKSEKLKILTMKEPKIPKNLSDALKKLTKIVNYLLLHNKLPIILGGEHSITPAILKSFNDQEFIIIHFDAHADLRDSYNGEKFSHASALRRCLDNKNVKLISFGIRNISSEELNFFEKNKNRIDMFFMRDRVKWNLEKLTKKIKNKKIYISFDVDCFDVSIMPATGTPEPGGLLWDDCLKILKKIIFQSKLIGFDVNELSPISGGHAYDFLVAKLIYKILNYNLVSKNKVEAK
jgi:agmatinase